MNNQEEISIGTLIATVYTPNIIQGVPMNEYIKMKIGKKSEFTKYGS